MGPEEKVSSPSRPVSTFTSTKLSPRSARIKERFRSPRPRVTDVPSAARYPHSSKPPRSPMFSATSSKVPLTERLNWYSMGP